MKHSQQPYCRHCALRPYTAAPLPYVHCVTLPPCPALLHTQPPPSDDEDSDEDSESEIDSDGSSSSSGSSDDGDDDSSTTTSGSDSESESESDGQEEEEGNMKESLEHYQQARREVLAAQQTLLTNGGCLLRSKVRVCCWCVGVVGVTTVQ